MILLVMRELVRDGVWYGLSLVIGRGATLLLLPLYTRALSPAEFGQADVLLAAITIAHVVAPLEISQAQARFLPDAAGPAERRAICATALVFTLIAYGALLALGLAFSGTLAGWSGTTRELVVLALLVAVAQGLQRVTSGQLRSDRRAGPFAAVSMTLTLVTAVATVATVVGGRMGSAGLLLGHLSGAVVGTVVAWWFTRGSWSSGLDRTQLGRMLAYSTPLVVSGVGVAMMLQVDRLALQKLATLSDVGVFGVAARLAGIVQLVIAGFQSALSPLIYATHREEGTPPALARLFARFSAAALALVLGLSLLSPELVALFAAPGYAGAAALLPILVPATLLASMYPFAPGADIAGRTGWLAAVNVSGGLVNATLSFALIPHLGVRGAALANLLASALQFAAYMVISQRLYPVPHRWGRLVAAAALTAALVSCGPRPEFTLAARLGLLVVGLAIVPWLAWSSEASGARSETVSP